MEAVGALDFASTQAGPTAGPPTRRSVEKFGCATSCRRSGPDILCSVRSSAGNNDVRGMQCDRPIAAPRTRPWPGFLAGMGDVDRLLNDGVPVPGWRRACAATPLVVRRGRGPPVAPSHASDTYGFRCPRLPTSVGDRRLHPSRAWPSSVCATASSNSRDASGGTRLWRLPVLCLLAECAFDIVHRPRSVCGDPPRSTPGA